MLAFLLCRQEPRVLGTVSFGPGTAICGVGLLAGGLLCAAGRLASGNVQVQAWQLTGDSRELQVLPTVAAPGMVWDAMQSMVGKAALAGARAGGEVPACGILFCIGPAAVQANSPAAAAAPSACLPDCLPILLLLVQM